MNNSKRDKDLQFLATLEDLYATPGFSEELKAVIQANIDATRSRLAAETEDEAHKARLREALAAKGYRLMHRRKGQYWMMHSTPRTLAQIESWLENTKGRAA
jgi:hypothetical protein